MFCAKVKEFLSQNKTEFIERDVASDETALDELQQLGYLTTPVTVVGDDLVVGFDADKLRNFSKLGSIFQTIRISQSDPISAPPEPA